MNDRQRLEAIVSVVCKYLPPDGISIEQAMNEIIGLVDPLPPQPKEQEPVAWLDKYGEIYKDVPEVLSTDTPLYTTPPQLEKRNFCPRCGKRTADLTVIHTCTPPQENT